MNSNRNPFARKTFGRVRRRTNNQKQADRQLREALAKIEQLKQLEDTVKILEADRKKTLEQQKEKEAAEAAIRADQEEEVRLERLVADAMRKHELRDQGRTESDSKPKIQKQPDGDMAAEASQPKKPWYRRLFNFQY